MEDRDSCDQGDDRGQESLTAEAGAVCTVAETEEGTAVFITSSTPLPSTGKAENKKGWSLSLCVHS